MGLESENLPILMADDDEEDRMLARDPLAEAKLAKRVHHQTGLVRGFGEGDANTGTLLVSDRQIAGFAGGLVDEPASHPGHRR